MGFPKPLRFGHTSGEIVAGKYYAATFRQVLWQGEILRGRNQGLRRLRSSGSRQQSSSLQDINS